MATLVAPQIGLKRSEDVFFTTVAWIMLAIVVLGFAPSYFLKGAVLAHLPSLLVHLHGAVFTSWIILFAVQSSLISVRKVRLHRKLGVLGAVIAGLMVLLGVLATFGTLHRGAKLPPFLTPASFLISNTIGIAYFGCFVAFAIWKRNDRILHKRTMFVANAMLLPPALFRMTIYPFMEHHLYLIGFIPLGFIAALLVFDLAHWRRPFAFHWKPIVTTLVLGFLYWVIGPISDGVTASQPALHLTYRAQHH